MGEMKRRLLLNLLKLSDLFCVLGSFGLSTVFIVHAQHRGALATFLSLRIKIVNYVLFFLILFVFHLVFVGFGLYRSRRLSTWRSESIDIVKASLISSGFLVVFGITFSVQMFTRSFVITFLAINTVLLESFRLSLRMVLARLRLRGRNLRYLVIFGTNPRAVALPNSRRILPAVIPTAAIRCGDGALCNRSVRHWNVLQDWRSRLGKRRILALRLIAGFGKQELARSAKSRLYPNIISKPQSGERCAPHIS